MKLKIQSRRRLAVAARRSAAAFTMVEIALALAVIGFALVAIIGVLPAGMNVQKDNREETLINFDADYLMGTLTSGAKSQIVQGQNDLTNYIISITNIITLLDTNGIALTSPAPVTNWFTTTNYSINGAITPGNILTNGAIIVGLLSTPKYMPLGTSLIESNFISADFRAISGNAMDQGSSQSSRDFAFSYRLLPEIIPSANYAYYGGNWINMTAPGQVGLTNLNVSQADALLAQNLQNNLTQIRLRFRWPILPGGGVGGGRQVYRTMASGTMTNVTFPALRGVRFHFLQPQSYQGTP